MTRKGYNFEHFIEQQILVASNQTLDTSIYNRSYRIPMSGAMRGEKGDIKTNIPWKFKFQFLIECKERYQSSKKLGRIFRLDCRWLSKLEEECKIEHRKPMFIFSFKGVKSKRVWCLLLKEDFQYLFSCCIKVEKILKKSNFIILCHQTITDGLLLNDKYCVINFNSFIELIKNNLN